MKNENLAEEWAQKFADYTTVDYARPFIPDSVHVYLSHVPFLCSEEDIESAFSEFGEVFKVVRMKDKFGFYDGRFTLIMRKSHLDSDPIPGQLLLGYAVVRVSYNNQPQ